MLIPSNLRWHQLTLHIGMILLSLSVGVLTNVIGYGVLTYGGLLIIHSTVGIFYHA